MDMTNIRLVKTSLYSIKAKEVLDAVLGQLSDGWGENNPRNDRYWVFARVFREADGQIMIAIDKNSGKADGGRWLVNAFYTMTDDAVLDFFARMAKKTAKMELKDDGQPNGWNRHNVDFKTRYLNYDEDISIAEVYCIYETLLKRPVNASKYSINVIESAIGKPRSNEETIAEQQKMDEAKRIKEEYEEHKKALNAERNEKLKKLNDEYIALLSNAWKEYSTKLNAIGYKI